jgi:hypothetical protein
MIKISLNRLIILLIFFDLLLHIIGFQTTVCGHVYVTGFKAPSYQVTTMIDKMHRTFLTSCPAIKYIHCRVQYLFHINNIKFQFR